MHRPTARVLTVLELLQARRMTGSELARRLEVDGRTVRRYVTTLQDMGIPVEGERGRYGAYHLRPGYKMPPLMFTDEEPLGLSLGLLAARQLGLAGVAPAVEGALAKVERVMPEPLRGRLRVLEQAVVLSAAPPASLPDGEMVSDIAGAVGGGGGCGCVTGQPGARRRSGWWIPTPCCSGSGAGTSSAGVTCERICVFSGSTGCWMLGCSRKRSSAL